MKFVKVLKTPILKNICERLLLRVKRFPLLPLTSYFLFCLYKMYFVLLCPLVTFPLLKAEEHTVGKYSAKHNNNIR